MLRPIVCATLVSAFVACLPAATAADGADAARLATLAKLVHDPQPKVRLEALRSLSRFHEARSAELALEVLDQPMDPALDYALWLTINELSEPWITALESGAWNPAGKEKQLAFALKSIRPEQASRVLGKALAQKSLARDGSGPWIELIGESGGPRELGALYRQLLDRGFEAPAAERALRSLEAAFRNRKLRPEGDPKAASSLLNSDSPEVRAGALRLAGTWKSHTPAELGLEKLAASDPAEGVRSAAFAVLRSLGGAESTAVLTRLVAAPAAATRFRAATTWAAIDLSAAGPSVIGVLRTLEDEAQALEFWRTLLAVKGAGKVLAGILPESGLPAVAARAGIRAAREGGRSDVDLATALARAGGLATDSQAFTGQWIRDLAAKATASGDPHRGEMVYRRPELACTTCHAIGGAGGRVGPDMTSIGASAQPDYLVESVLRPDAKIKEGYHGVVVETKDGQTVSGTVVRESGTELVLRSPANQEVVLAKSSIEQRSNATASIMPGGLIDALPESEQADLFAFLSRLGKPGDFDASRGGVARRWRIANLVHTDVQNGQGDWMWKADTKNRRWTEILSRVNGDLTRGLMEGGARADFWTSKLAVLAMTEVSTSEAGPVAFSLGANPATELWVDGAKVTGPVQLAAGLHRVIVKVDPTQVPDRIRLESKDASFRLD
jgi:putative heme-binding domain-containing protein